MAGLGMRDIKRRIKSVNSTKQITKAMELVSSAKLRKIRERLDKNRHYFTTIAETVQDIIAGTKGIKHDFINPREVKKSVYIVITGDRGLCGGYNTNILKTAVSHMQDKKEVSVIVIGQKGRDFYKKRNYDLDGEFTHISENITLTQAQSIGNLSMELYKQNMADEVYLVYSEFISTINYKPRVIKLLPLQTDTGQEGRTKSSKGYIMYDPSPEEVLDYLIPKYINSMIFGAVIESATSEQAARRVAMENATDNAVEMIDKLKLKYNRARQASITQEIAEIVGGAEALK